MSITMDTIRARHSVRSYTSEPISASDRAALEAQIERGNAEGKLHMKLVCNDTQAFDSTMAHYGKFSGVENFVILAGPAASDLEERCGYYGEQVALLAQDLGLNTCWVAMTFKKRYVKKMLAAGDKMPVVLALGHGATQGIAHTNKLSEADACGDYASAPAWFKQGIEAALLAPTAMNQQSFKFELAGERNGKPAVKASSKGGFYSKVDLGIVKYHFEVGAGTQNFVWA